MMRRIACVIVAVAGLLGATVALASSPASADLKVIIVRTDTVPGIYTLSWQTRYGCDPGPGTEGASGSMSWTVVDERVEFALVINDICEYDLSATFRNADGATCRIAPGSLRVSNDEVDLAVEPNSCATTGAGVVVTIRTDTVGGIYTVSWRTRGGCDPGPGTSGASGSLSRLVVNEPREMPLVINRICEYDLSARFVNLAEATCRIAPASLRISNDEVNLAVVPNSCTGTPDRPSDEAPALTIDESDDADNPLNARLAFVASSDGDRVVASWSPPSGRGGSPITGYVLTIARPGRIFGPYHLSAGNRRAAIRNPLPATIYTMRVVAETATGSGSESTTSVTTPSAALPSPPRNLSATPHGARQLRVTWSPPPGSASATISHYLVRYSRPAIGGVPPWQSRLYRATSTSHTSPNLRYGTTYTVEVAAVNNNNRASSTATTQGTTSARAPQ